MLLLELLVILAIKVENEFESKSACSSPTIIEIILYSAFHLSVMLFGGVCPSVLDGRLCLSHLDEQRALEVTTLFRVESQRELSEKQKGCTDKLV